MESSLVSARHNIRQPYMSETLSTSSVCFNWNSAFSQTITTGSLCNTPMETGSQQEQVVAKDEDPEFQELSDQLLEWEDELLDLEDKKRESMYKTEEVNVYGSKLSSLGQNIPDSLCDTPMETGSQQEQVVATDGDPEFTAQLLDLEKEGESNVYGRKLSSWGQNIPDSFCNTPMETGSQQEQVVATDGDPEFTAQLLDLEKEGESNVYGRKLSSWGQNIPDSLCNTPIETGSQQEQVVAKDEDPEFQELANQLLEWEAMETECHQKAKQLCDIYQSILLTIGIQRFDSSMQITPCLGECRRKPNVSVLHNQHCVLYNMDLLKKLQKQDPKILQKVKENLTNINMDRDDFKNLLFHEKLSKMLNKIECAVKYMVSCCDKYIYLLAFKLQLTALVKGGRNSHHNPNPVIKFLNHMEEKIADVDELTLDLMQKDMSYYQLKVDLNNMLEMMSQHKYAEVVEMYYNLLKLESRIDTFIENYKKVSESVKEKLDIQNNYTDCESISFYYDRYEDYINILINHLDKTNSILDNNGCCVGAPIISHPHLTDFYKKMHITSYQKVYQQKRTLCQLTKESDICLLMKDLSRLLYDTEELHVTIEKTLDILESHKQSDVNQIEDARAWIHYSNQIKEARARILYSTQDYSENTYPYLSVKELGRMEMKKTLVYRNTKVPIESSLMTNDTIVTETNDTIVTEEDRLEDSLRCMTLCMWLSLSRGREACETVQTNKLCSRLCNNLGSEFQFLEEYVNNMKASMYKLLEKWFPQ